MRNLSSLITAFVLSFSTVAAVGCATTGSDEYSETDDEAAAAGTFDLWKTESDGQYRFHLSAGNKNILLTSEGYTTRTNAINGLLSVTANGVDPAQYEVAKASNGKYFLRLRSAANGQIIGFTQLYSSKSNATRAVASCVRAVTSYLDKAQASAGTRAHVAVEQDDAGKFSFSVLDKKGAVVVASHAYQSEAAAWNGAFAIQEGSAKDTLYKVVDTGKGFQFTATALNGAVVATSPTFETQAQAQAALDAARALVAKLDIL